MDERKKIFFIGAATVVAALLTAAIMAAIMYDRFGAERGFILFIAASVAIMVSSVYAVEVSCIGSVGISVPFAVIYVSLVVRMVDVTLAGAITLAGITTFCAAFICGLAYSDLAYNKCSVAFPRLFGCFLGEVGAIGFGFFFLSNPVFMAGAGSAGMALMFASLYTPCPQFLRVKRKLASGTA